MICTHQLCIFGLSFLSRRRKTDRKGQMLLKQTTSLTREILPDWSSSPLQTTHIHTRAHIHMI